ncbi:MAG: DEAD/DEAH box helicase [Candidatus Micrarchaeota archaeon]|nr:DEAD/DEAH box helicase [Candidatus Micrarchaeota archaeon]
MQLQETWLKDALQKLGYASLNPMQEKAVPAVLGNGKAVVSAPTASGKTLLALLKMADNFEKTGSKAVYIVPLRALASEKFEEFSQALSSFNMRVGISTGDLDSSSEDLHAFDVVVVTSEKMDSLTRHGAKWLDTVGLAVVDEAHLLNDYSRGATLEIVLTKLLRRGCSILALSATIPNAKEVAGWLAAQLVVSDYRPTKLVLGVCPGRRIDFADRSEKLGKGKVLDELVSKCLSGGARGASGQVLVFVNTRKKAEAAAGALKGVVEGFLDHDERKLLAALSEKALHSLQYPTKQCRMLSDCLRSGIAFHHAGIESAQRRLIEAGFKKDKAVKVIVCTTTLAMGIDYPASWVIVRDLKRFNGAYSEFIPALECAQMTGRAGRPRYDSAGTGVLVCAPDEVAEVKEKYVFGPLEDIESRLSSEPVLRTHCLALVASGYCKSFKELFEFFNDTFYAFHAGGSGELLGVVEKIVAELKEMDFVREKAALLFGTPLGKRVSELYVDPLSAHSLMQFIISGRKPREMGLLMELANATEMRPLVSVSRKEEQALFDEMEKSLDDFTLERALGDEFGIAKYKTAKVLAAWMNEETEDKVMSDYGLPPGILHGRVKIAEWLAYALRELAFTSNQTGTYSAAKAIERRLMHGVKEELLELCRIRGVGRVRARRLWNAGIKTAEEFRAAPKEKIKEVVKG